MPQMSIVRGGCFFCLLMMLTPDMKATADAPANIELLKMVAGGIRANHESLRTWVGRARIEDKQ